MTNKEKVDQLVKEINDALNEIRDLSKQESFSFELNVNDYTHSPPYYDSEDGFLLNSFTANRGAMSQWIPSSMSC